MTVSLFEKKRKKEKKLNGKNFHTLIGEWIWGTKIPVGAVWKLLPWNNGRPASCNIKCKYVDDDFRVMEDNDKELFVYTRPVCSRPQ
jgi:hypothetical protein